MKIRTRNRIIALAAAVFMTVPAGMAYAAQGVSTPRFNADAEAAVGGVDQALVVAQLRRDTWRERRVERRAERRADRRGHQLRGHRGYPHRRSGYRRHADGWWYPQAAFFMGRTVERAHDQRNYSARHHNWCGNRYRSYRRSDGTFQPYNGSRRRCNSPY